LTLIDLGQPVREHVIEGFPYVINQLYDASERAARSALLGGLSELCLAPPFAADYQQISRKHTELASRLHPLARLEVLALGAKEPPPWLIRVLMVVERAERHHGSSDENPSLHNLVRAHRQLNRSLFWADVEFSQEHSPHVNPLTHWAQVHFYGGTQLWAFGPADLDWLKDDMRSGESAYDRRIALSAVLAILHGEGRLNSEADDLRNEIGEQPDLLATLDQYLAPPPERDMDTDHEREMARLRRERVARTQQDKASWVEFANFIRAEPGRLRDPAQVRTWKAGAFRLKHLTLWLQKRTDKQDDEAPRDWRLLEEGFGPEVAAAYRDGMKLIWRLMPPKRTVRQPGNGVTYSWTQILSYGGIGLEAAEDPEWAEKLTEDEARLAVQHACFLGRRYLDWMDGLIVAHSQAVVPIIRKEIAAEWGSDNEFYSEFLSRYAHPPVGVPIPIQSMLVEILFAREAPSVAKLERGVRIVRNVSFDGPQRVRLTHVARKRLADHAAAGRDDYFVTYLGLLMVLDADQAIEQLATWIDGADENASKHTQEALGNLFDRHDPLISGGLEAASVPALQKLVRLAYSHVRPEHDIVHQGSLFPGFAGQGRGRPRHCIDDSASSARC
jgi:hypothetical protein